ncbi:hypothetical protein PGT21_032517 [Puccinia graminis f. sp. tritici]|uniref:Uncharacterized protein n=2 Tax=Puccinia graminis f. sp. tritici TaxID=56615 RepID=A0A5B0QJZ7_PUCGR|nr:hypothetical protein PGT21_032517 [Puccinia graminis f. sp. tritici]
MSSSKFNTVYESLPPPIPAAIEIIRHILVSPSSLFEAPLSRPVLERLQWIKPSLEDERESHLYFNNMVDHGASGRAHELRMELIHAGPSAWHFCAPSEVHYKADERCLDSDGLCEIFSRVTVWKARDSDAEAVQAREKLALILKLESDPPEPADPTKKGSWDHLSWKYFDLQDLVTPGLDTRPWFDSPRQAALRPPIHQNSGGPKDREQSGDEDADYWAGFSSRSDDSSMTSGSDGRGQARIPTDPALAARIRNTPLYRSKAPSVCSPAASDDHVQPQGTPSLGGPSGPIDLRARIARTPLFKRAPSVEDCGPLNSALPGNPSTAPDLLRLLDAARIVNLPSDPPVRPAPPPTLPLHPPLKSSLAPLPQPSGASSTSQNALQDKILDSLRATFHLYRLCLHNPASPSSSSSSALSAGESFVALAHRVVMQDAAGLNQP